MPEVDSDRFDAIAEEFAARCRTGETPAVSDYMSRYPDLAAELQELLPTVAQMEWLKLQRKNAPAEIPLSENPPERIGEYRIIRELGRGGMGIVYEAVQESLNRQVALKLLPNHHRIDKNKRDRFLREAQAAARLHHTNIVSVYAVGEEKGIPYIVMQYIPGWGLHDMIATWRERRSSLIAAANQTEVWSDSSQSSASGLTRSSSHPHNYSESRIRSSILKPNDWRSFARIGAEAAHALHYAHERGVLHRDVKPGNLLLDLKGNVYVADFGLAKMLDQESLTATGDVLGTVQYMAPEALHGEADERTDVYGLGMTLYELATRRIPFDVSTPALLIKAITENDPPLPRTWNPEIPRDLETIILKAIAREPNTRYASAEDLAVDLEAFLHDIPIRARRTTWVDRTGRWIRTNPVISGLTMLTFSALLFATAVGWTSYVRTQAAYEQELQLRKDAEHTTLKLKEANQKLHDNLTTSFDGFEAVLNAALYEDPNLAIQGPPDGNNRPGGPPDGMGGRRGMRDGPFRGDGRDGPQGPRGDGPNGRDGPPRGDGRDGRDGPQGPPRELNEADQKVRILEAMLEFYIKYAEKNDAEKLKLQAAIAYRKVGEVHHRLHHNPQSEEAIQKSMGLLLRLREERPNDQEVLREYELTSQRQRGEWPAPPRRPGMGGSGGIFGLGFGGPGGGGFGGGGPGGPGGPGFGGGGQGGGPGGPNSQGNRRQSPMDRP